MSNDKWVSTIDELPNFNQRVTVCIDGQYVRDGKFTSFGWFVYDSVGLIEVSKTNKITHWMPLPQPPKQ